jgi:hypothetical protein
LGKKTADSGSIGGFLFLNRGRDVSVETEGLSHLSKRGEAGISELFPAEEKNPDGKGSVSRAVEGSLGLFC